MSNGRRFNCAYTRAHPNTLARIMVKCIDHVDIPACCTMEDVRAMPGTWAVAFHEEVPLEKVMDAVRTAAVSEFLFDSKSNRLFTTRRTTRMVAHDTVFNLNDPFVYLVPFPEGGMRVTLKTLSGHTYPVPGVAPSSTVQEFMESVEVVTACPPSVHRFVCAGKTFGSAEAASSLADVGVKHGSHVIFMPTKEWRAAPHKPLHVPLPRRDAEKDRDRDRDLPDRVNVRVVDASSGEEFVFGDLHLRSTMLGALLDRVAAVAGVPVHQIELAWRGADIVSKHGASATLFGVGVRDDVTMAMSRTTKDNISLFVKTLTGSTLTLADCSASTMRIEELKGRIAKALGLPPEQQRLIHAGRHVEEGHVLSDYNIRNESTLFLNLRLSGGMHHATSGRSGTYGALPSDGTRGALVVLVYHDTVETLTADQLRAKISSGPR